MIWHEGWGATKASANHANERKEYMDTFDPVKVAELINLPEDHAVSFMIAVGKGTKPAWPKPGQLPLEEVVVHNRFS